MNQVSLDKLETGSVLAADVKDRSGRLLLKAGCEVEERHLKIFQTWGISTVCIADAEVNDLEDIDPEIRALVREEVKKNFNGNDFSHPAISMLVEICVDRELVQQGRGHG